MTLKTLLLITLVLVVNANIFAVEKVIYGDDNRVDVIDSSNSEYVRLALSTAARIDNFKLKLEGDVFKLEGQTLLEQGFCSGDLFTEQIAAADCSGFLVGDDLLVTAGHCMKDADQCQNNSWVFDYRVNGIGKADTVPANSVYGCKEIIEQKLDSITMEDYALIRLDRPVSGRVPLEFRKSGKIDDNEELVIIGHPIGLPSKISDQANVRTNNNDFYFVTNLDSFGGNSGSAVFNATTGKVEGILVRGEQDFNFDYERGCYEINYCDTDGCRGEEVTRITRIKALQK